MIRLGNVVIDTDTMTADDCDVLIDEFRRIADRKRTGDRLLAKFSKLVQEAREAGFEFYDKTFATTITSSDFDIIDYQN